MKKYCLILALFVTTSFAVNSQTEAEAGKAKSLICAACHGTDGNSAIPMNPKLAGQHKGYLVKQLHEFKIASKTGGQEGRNNAIMNAQAMNLSDQDMQELAAYFSSQELKTGEAAEDAVAAGEALYRGGDADRGITACIACHSADGKGMNLAGFPVISGQHASYTQTQLEMFRSGKRNNDLNGMMRGVASKLSDDDIRVLSSYLQGLY